MADTTLKIAELREALAGVPNLELKKSLKKPELVALYREHIGSPPKKSAGKKPAGKAGKKPATKVVLEMELAPAPKKASSGKSKAKASAKAKPPKPAPKSPSAMECQEMTVVQLKAYLKKVGVAHKSTAKKPELIELCLGHRAPAKPAKSGSGSKSGKKKPAAGKKPAATRRKVVVASSSGSKSGSLSPLKSADDYMAMSIAALKDQLAKRKIKTAAKTKTGMVKALVKSGGGPITAAGRRLAAMAAAATSPEAEKAVAAAEKAVEAAEKAEAAAGAAVAAAASAIKKPLPRKPSPKKPSPPKKPGKPLPAPPKKPSGGKKIAIETRWRDCGDGKMYDLDIDDCGGIRNERYLLVNGARVGGSREAMDKLKRSLETEGIAHSWENNPSYRILYEDQECPEGEAYDLDRDGCAPFGTSTHQLAFKDAVITGSKATLEAYKKRLDNEQIPSKISAIPKGKAGKVKPTGGKVKPAAGKAGSKPASREPSPRVSPARGSGSGGRIATNPLHKDPGVLTDHLKTLSECLASLG